jgi:ion channel-forming bestrophin family protein
MYTKKTRSFNVLLKDFGPQFLWYAPYVTAVYYFYEHAGYTHLDIKMSIATVLGFAVALLLGFRTSSAYDRWWEARKIWGGIVNDSRTLVRQFIGFTDVNEILPEARQLSNYQIAWCNALKSSLRNLNPLEGLEGFLSQEELNYLSTKNNKPNEILKLMNGLLAKVKAEDKIDTYQLVSLDQTLKHLCDHMGKAERIKNTVFPTQYRSYTHRGLIIFTVMLPYGMLFSTGPFVILICVLVSFFFHMLENIAYFLQDPFMNRPSDIPMSALCRTIEINLKELVEETDIPNPLGADAKGVLM